MWTTPVCIRGTRVASEKVIVDAQQLAPAVRHAIAHAHDAERPGL
jgi:hypothetical protein